MVLFASAAGAAELAPLMKRSILLVAAIETATDNMGAGWCGRGMLSILRNVGLGCGLAGGNGQDRDISKQGKMESGSLQFAGQSSSRRCPYTESGDWSVTLLRRGDCAAFEKTLQH
jgi:hypothetical protein